MRWCNGKSQDAQVLAEEADSAQFSAGLVVDIERLKSRNEF